MPRRLSFLALALLLAGTTAGCRDALSAHADVAAEAAGQTLPSERLADLMVNAKGLTLNPEAARDVANFWVDFTLFSQAMADGAVFSDSATIAQAMWREITELRGNHWYDTLVGRRTDVTPAMVEALYGGDSLRVLQHILIRLPQGAPSADSATALATAQDLVTRTRGAAAAEFGALAVAHSADPGSARDSGYLPPSPRGAFVTAFDSAGWALAPGQVSGLVRTPYGFHVIRRPTLTEVGARVEAFLAREAAGRLDQAYMDSLALLNNLKVNDDAPALMRQAADDPDEWEGSKRRLATYTGGQLTVADYLQWLRALPPPFLIQARTTDEENLRGFAKALATNLLLIRQADSAGVQITPEEWQTVRGEYLARLDTISALIGIGPDVRDTLASAAVRQRLAARMVDDYLTKIANGEARLRPLPSSSFAATLRQRYDHSVNAAGLARAVELAEARRQAIIDSTGVDPKAAPPLPGAPLDPAAGPPPVGGGTAPAPGGGQ